MDPVPAREKLRATSPQLNICPTEFLKVSAMRAFGA